MTKDINVRQLTAGRTRDGWRLRRRAGRSEWTSRETLDHLGKHSRVTEVTQGLRPAYREVGNHSRRGVGHARSTSGSDRRSPDVALSVWAPVDN